MAKKHQDYRAKAIGLGVDPKSPHLSGFDTEHGENHFLALKYLIKKYPDMSKEEAAEKALLFNEHSAQVLGFAIRKGIDLTVEEALSFKQHHKMAFVVAHKHNIDLSVNEVAQITNMEQFNVFRDLLNAGNGKEGITASLGIRWDPETSANEVLMSGEGATWGDL